MDQNSLRRLAETGIREFPPGDLAHLADWCWDFGEATGDARYCSLSRSFGMIADLFESHGAAPLDLVLALDELVQSRIGPILDAETAADGSYLARLFREDVAAQRT